MERTANQITEIAKEAAKRQRDIAADTMASAERISVALGVAVAIVLLGSAIFSVFTIARPMRALTGGMLELADGNFDVVLPGLGRKDEIGDVAAAVETFKVPNVP